MAKWVDKFRRYPKEAYLCLLAAMIIRAVTGIQYVFGNLLPYIASYLASKHGNTQEKYDQYTQDASWLYTAFITPCNCCFVVGALMERRIGLRATTLIGITLMNLGLFLTYFTCDTFCM